ncbi:MAG: hypothetical protein AAF203_01450 [Pseudomonadota bacterium]
MNLRFLMIVSFGLILNASAAFGASFSDQCRALDGNGDFFDRLACGAINNAYNLACVELQGKKHGSAADILACGGIDNEYSLGCIEAQKRHGGNALQIGACSGISDADELSCVEDYLTGGSASRIADCDDDRVSSIGPSGSSK